MPQQLSRSEPGSTKTREAFPVRARAPGKIILSGEHFVVLGAPAVAMAIDFYSEVEARPNDKSGVRIGVDVPLRFLSSHSGSPLKPRWTESTGRHRESI